MNKTDIKRVIGTLVPDKEMEYRLSEKILKKEHNTFAIKPSIYAAAAFIIIISLGIFAHNFLYKKLLDSSYRITAQDTRSNVNTSDSKNTAEGIYIPKIQLPKNINTGAAKSSADMIGLVVYQGRVYTQTGIKINSENAENLLGEKLGTTKGNIDEWSKQKDYAVEFASTIGKQDVYSVKGYDKNFRIMTYEKINGTMNAQFYECINGITVKTGADIFNKLRIENNIKTSKYKSFESWNNNKQQYENLKNMQILSSFVDKLKYAIPYTQGSKSYFWNDKAETNQKFVYIILKDGSQIQLRLFKDGYIYYDSSHIFFKMEDQTFNKLWDELK